MHVRELFDLTGKVAIVTGGSRGLGLEVAEGLAEAGAKVTITGRRRQWLDPAKAELEAKGFEVLALDTDVSDPDGVRRTVEETAARFGGIDILINNAGAAWGAPSLEFPLNKWQEVIDTNLTGAWIMAQAVAPHMIARGGGKIVNVSSVLGQRGIDTAIQDSVPYHASKGGLDALTRQLSVAWAKHGIYVNSVSPGYFRTKMTQTLFASEEANLAALSPFNRTGGPDEMKGVVLFLASAASNFVTGHALNVDGGMAAW